MMVMPVEMNTPSTSLHEIRFAQPAPIANRLGDADLRLWVSIEPMGARLSEVEFAKDAVDLMADLQPDWDGYGALPISSVTRDNVKRALETICRSAPIPEITPNPNGTLSCEWESPRGYAHLEIGMSRFSFYVRPKAGESIPGDGQATNVPSEIGSYIAALLFPDRTLARAVTSISYNQSRPAFAT